MNLFAEAKNRGIQTEFVDGQGHRRVTDAAALEIMHQRGCDLLISDHRMPGMTGLELLQAVRAAQPILPVVIISADVTAETAAIEAGVTAFFYKPLTIVQIRQIVETWLPTKPPLNPHTAAPSG